MDLSTTQLATVALILYSVKLFMDHQSNLQSPANQDPNFRLFGGYPNVSNFKHDVFKVVVTDIIPLLLITGNPDVLFSTDNFFESLPGRILIVFSSYLVFYHFVEPYIANQTRIF
jgi:hypothetical protein